MDVVFLTSIFSKQSELYRPLGVYQLAWFLREHSYSVQVIDFIQRFTAGELVAAAEKHITPQTKILGFGAMFNKKEAYAYMKFVEMAIRELKRRHPQLIVLAGGVNIEQINKEYPNNTLFDYLFYGHAENTLVSFCNAIYKGKIMPTVEKVNGNRIIREGAADLIPFPRKFDIQTCGHLFTDQDNIQPGESLPIELARGCIFSCKYCRYPYIGKKKNDYIRDFELVKREMLHNYEKWGVTNYYLLDDTFNDNQVKLEAWVEMVKTLPFKIHYSCYMRPDLLHAHQDNAVELSEVGLASTFLGVESFHPEAANMVGKAWSGKHAKEWLPKLYHDLWKEKTTFRMGFIAGLPPDTFKDLMSTHDWAVSNKLPNWIWHGLNISRDASNAWTSEFDRNAEKYGFEWFTQDGSVLWRTKYSNAILANDWATSLNTLARPHQKMNCWTLIELGNYGYDIDVVKHSPTRFASSPEVGIKRQEFFDRYKKQVLA
jgi:radical SAM superfamily enzyme YgiQ (UPF0313 family)